MKKRTLAILLAAALIAVMPLSALAASSPNTGSSSGGGGGGRVSSGRAITTTTNTTVGTPTMTADGQSLNTNGAGSQNANVKATFAVGGAETAGLPEGVVTTITSINSGVDLVTAVGNATLEGYAALTKTSAIILNDITTNVVANQEVPVTLYIPNLISGLENVRILYYENATGQWKVVEPTAIDFENKTVTFNMFGSGTVTVIHK